MESGACGKLGFVHLAQGHPPLWREALCLGEEDGWLHLLIRAAGPEDIPQGMSRLEVQGNTYFLLGCRMQSSWELVREKNI